MKPKLSSEEKVELIHNLNIKIGSDINNLEDAYEVEQELQRKKKQLENCIAHFSSIVNLSQTSQLSPIKGNDHVSAKHSATIRKAEANINQITDIKNKSVKLTAKIDQFLSKTESFREELDKRFSTISKLEGVLLYFKSFEKIDDLSRQMKQCRDNEQLIQLYGELKGMCSQHTQGHQAAYIKEYKHYWHNILKENFSKHYEDILKALKWPITSASESSPPSKDVLMKFSNLTRYLFIIQEPEDQIPNSNLEDLSSGSHTSLPVRIMLRPLKKRFQFHFTGTRQTARIDRPEWFLTQTLTWIKDHRKFVNDHVQPVADKLELSHINAVDEFNNGLISFAAERLHTVLGLYISQGSKGEIVDVDAAFAHAVDETLGFHRELQSLTGYPLNMALHVLTKAEHFVRWIAVEKKYALAKMDEALESEQWCEPVAAGVSVAVGAALWVPRCADWFIALLKTIEDRYSMLPQPGHRLQFVELQLELIEEWRVRLTQLLGAALHELRAESLLAGGPQPLAAVLNAAHYTRTVLLQWAHSLHYLQLHFYRRQFEHFTQQQHKDDEVIPEDTTVEEECEENLNKSAAAENIYQAMSINELEFKAKMLALNEMSRQNSVENEPSLSLETSQKLANLSATDALACDADQLEESGVFGEAPSLLAHLRDAGLSALSDHILLEFKATIREYKKLKWHAMLMVEEMGLSVSGALCGPLSALCARLAAAALCLAPPLAARLRAHLAARLDHLMLQVHHLPLHKHALCLAPPLAARLRAHLAARLDHLMLQVHHLPLHKHALCLAPPLAARLRAHLAARLDHLMLQVHHLPLHKHALCLAPPLAARLRAHLAARLDHLMLQEMVLETWFNTGGTLQFTHDVKRNILPAFAPHNKSVAQLNLLPKLLEACKLLNMDYEEARRLRSLLVKQPAEAKQTVDSCGITHIEPKDALRILNQRTDLTDTTTPSSVMELF
ncbi:RAD50-interacting protein 1 [Papilio machaon]|uniref:RAD50-interacting protein 1 n=1 Tax=Papilio machaon TaxID=76193 RepID=A0A194QRJ6_PAPMA|nr:RAD50-interacting protein 1 [Papilio machaon]